LEVLAELADRGLVFCRHGKAGNDRNRPFGEKTNRLRAGKRWDSKADLSANSKWTPTGYEDTELRTAAQKSVGKHGACIEEMLNVIEHDERVLRREVFGQSGHEPTCRLVA